MAERTTRGLTQRQLFGRYGGYVSWANTVDREARMAKVRAGFEAKFLREADGDPKRAESARKAYFARLQLAEPASAPAPRTRT